MRKFCYLFMAFALLTACHQEKSESGFVKADGKQFTVAGKPYYFVGVNFWYGAILASQGVGGDRERLAKELDLLQEIGVNNLRILVGSDGASGVPIKVEPTLQLSPGVYNDTILDGLDFLMVELSKRNMYAVLYLNNSWEWSGGYSQYLEWAGAGKAPIPSIDGYPAYMTFVQQFHQNDSAKAIFKNYVRDIVTRTNRYTNRPYADDPTLMSWQIGNEPRAFSDENKENFALWIGDVADYIKSLDANHMVSTGSEGLHGCENDIDLWTRIHSYESIDYANIHIWPYNWKWVNKDSLSENLAYAKQQTKVYIDRHIAALASANKPIVLEEFGFPRDNFQFAQGTPTSNRDSYYGYVFGLISDNIAQKSALAGCNIWAWGGYARPEHMHLFWQAGDDYTGDPAQEEQGLNSVFATDTTTLNVMKSASSDIKSYTR